MPKISVLIVTYNRAHLIGETIRSVLGQTYQDIELIIIDDGSTDATESVVQSFNDKRILLFKYPRIGRLTRLRNIAVQKSSGDFIAFIDSDDLWKPDKLEKCLKACYAHNALICVADCQEFNTDGLVGKSRGAYLNQKTSFDIKEEILVRNLPLAYGSNLFFSKALYLSVKFDEKMVAGDHDFLVNALVSGKYVYLTEVLTLIRRHSANMSSESKNELFALLEFNRTVQKLCSAGMLSKKVRNNIVARNYSGLAYYYLERGALQTSLLYAFSSFKTKAGIKKELRYLRKLFTFIPGKK